ncbi:hydroxymethylglutaryl-CoA synthase [Leptotrichia sp. OH3620_COT-345]|uniref:hydroxymethylglutaryl-CoA synthase n=1 Tax=Leptotrichia sp. OH3620_COT-345 TaxID=2491048 RepID=UPI000F647E21|nr:hydroxymethylglutaryl-CoA synthase [Leptotrichia sp. OH3620_COT-345]RRD38936.1 hydroxymethylglutaryl-CoA synthase [Leptotrichia sp. OH3620_COT-345]
MKIGIDKIGFAMPKYYLDIEDLAIGRNANPNKFKKGLMQLEMSVSPVSQDIVTLGSAAAYEILDSSDREKIDMIIMCTETGIDHSKAASVFIHNLLKIQPFTRSVEIKEACYGATAGLNFAKNHIEKNPDSYVLVIASDIAKYGINSQGESTQGAGSCAMLLKKNPKLLILNDDNVFHTRDIMDFWRPNYSKYPCVNGHFSAKQYLDCLTVIWNEYLKRNSKTLEDFEAVCFHLPYPKLGLKGLQSLFPESFTKEMKDKFLKNFESSIVYNQKIGNIYTGSLYLSLLSLLENSNNLKSGDSIAMYSYGSGAVGEIFSVTLAENFKKSLRIDRKTEFSKRHRLSVNEYEKIFFEEITVNEEGNFDLNNSDDSIFSLEKIENHKRIYKSNIKK